MTIKHLQVFRQIVESDVPIRGLLRNPEARLAEGEKLAALLAPLITTFLTTFHVKAEADLKVALEMVAEGLLFHGLMTHCLLLQSDYRLRFDDQMDREALLTKWLVESLKASSMLRSYDAHNRNIPTAIFNAVFDKHVEPIQKALGFGWWRRSKNRATFLDLFAAGVLLGFQYDVTSKEIAERAT